MKKRAKAGETEVAVAEDEHFAGHQKKPAAGNRHHGIPDQADSGEGKVELGEALPAAETIDHRSFIEFAGNRFQRGIKTEGDVPDLARKYKQDGAEFDAKLAVREKSDHG